MQRCQYSEQGTVLMIHEVSYVKNCKNMQSETESLLNQHSKFISCSIIVIIIMLLKNAQVIEHQTHWKSTLQCTGKK